MISVGLPCFSSVAIYLIAASALWLMAMYIFNPGFLIKGWALINLLWAGKLLTPKDEKHSFHHYLVDEAMVEKLQDYRVLLKRGSDVIDITHRPGLPYPFSAEDMGGESITVYNIFDEDENHVYSGDEVPWLLQELVGEESSAIADDEEENINEKLVSECTVGELCEAITKHLADMGDDDDLPSHYSSDDESYEDDDEFEQGDVDPPQEDNDSDDDSIVVVDAPEELPISQ